MRFNLSKHNCIQLIITPRAYKLDMSILHLPLHINTHKPQISQLPMRYMYFISKYLITPGVMRNPFSQKP